LNGLKILERQLFAFENDFGFFFVINLPFHGFYKVLDWSCSLDFIADNLINEVLNLDKGMKFLLRLVFELNVIRDFAQLSFDLHENSFDKMCLMTKRIAFYINAK
jgi:hypothetical protein